MKKYRVQVTFKLPAEVRKDGSWWIAVCPPLDIASQGHTQEEAKSNLGEAVTFFLESCIERRSFFDVIGEAGLMAPVVAHSEIEAPADTMDVPLPFLIAAAEANRRDDANPR